MKPGDWLGYSADETEADVYKLAVVELKVPKDAVEVLWTGGAWLARKKQKEIT